MNIIIQWANEMCNTFKCKESFKLQCTGFNSESHCDNICSKLYLIKNSQAVKKGAAPKKAMVKKDVKSKVAAKKWL